MSQKVAPTDSESNAQIQRHFQQRNFQQRISPPVGTVPYPLYLPTESTQYTGLSLHQGSLPFVTLNGIHITFSPFLLGVIGAASAFSALYVEELSHCVLLPLLTVLLVLSQLVGNLVTGWLCRVKPQSLILSLTGVIDPELVIYRTKTRTTDTSNNTTQDGDVASAADPLHGVWDKLAPLRALGSSFGAVVFLVALYHSPLKELLTSEAALVEYFWPFACFLVVAPFLPPHRMSGSFKRRLMEGVVPLILYMIALAATQHISFSPVQFSEVVVFGLAALFRAFWWSRIAIVSDVADNIRVRDAMIPFANLECFSHGETTVSAQTKALRHPQSIFPLLNGNNLVGFVRKEQLLKASIHDETAPFVPSLAESEMSFVTPETQLENCFGPDLYFPLFVLEEDVESGEAYVTGVVTSDQVRDSLLIALTGNTTFCKPPLFDRNQTLQPRVKKTPETDSATGNTAASDEQPNNE